MEFSVDSNGTRTVGWSGMKISIRLYVSKRYLAYRAEPPFAAISGIASSWDSREDSANTLCVATWAPALVRELHRAAENKTEIRHFFTDLLIDWTERTVTGLSDGSVKSIRFFSDWIQITHSREDNLMLNWWYPVGWYFSRAAPAFQDLIAMDECACRRRCAESFRDAPSPPCARFLFAWDRQMWILIPNGLQCIPWNDLKFSVLGQRTSIAQLTFVYIGFEWCVTIVHCSQSSVIDVLWKLSFECFKL